MDDKTDSTQIIGRLADNHPASRELSQLTREALHQMVWNLPISAIALEHGVKSAVVVQLCNLLNIPRPQPGHWQKLAYGKASAIVALPQVGISSLPKQSSPKTSAATAIPQRVDKERAAKTGEGVASSSTQTRTARPSRPTRHHLLAGKRELYLKGRVLDSGYLKPSKKNLPDIIVSEAHLNVALQTASLIYTTLEKSGYRIQLNSDAGYYSPIREIDRRVSPSLKPENLYPALWTPGRATVLNIKGSEIGLVLFEMTEPKEFRYVNGIYIPVSELASAKKALNGNSWTSTREVPTGRFCLQAYSARHPSAWSMQWREEEKLGLRSLGDEILTSILGSVEKIAAISQAIDRKDAEDRRIWEENWEKTKQEMEARRRQELSDEAKKDLLRIISNWDESRRIHNFFTQIDEALQSDNGKLNETRIKLAKAKSLFSSVDALDALLHWQAPDER